MSDLIREHPQRWSKADAGWRLPGGAILRVEAWRSELESAVRTVKDAIERRAGFSVFEPATHPVVRLLDRIDPATLEAAGVR